MKILFDTNIVLDLLLDRKPFSDLATILFSLAEEKIIAGFLGATTVTTIFYLATKVVGKKKAEEAISKLLTIFTIAPVNGSVLEAALKSKFSDFEDAVLYQAAYHSNIQAIVTRDVVGFKHSTIPVYSPDELCTMVKALK
ncbi:MAG: PIN domain-containing protein [Desulfamplus sp.]|nr:PIN domain-containing protein [Desulfamplus sp.]